MTDRKMTVLQLLPSLDSGGVERGTIEVSKALCQAGHHSIVMSAGGRLVSELEKMGAQHIQWDIGKKSLSTLRYVFRLRSYLKKNDIDILHARSRLPAWIAWFAWKSMKVAHRPHFVTTVHGLYSVKKYSSIMMRGEKVIAVSNTVKNYMLDNYPRIKEENIEVIYRGVDDTEFPYGYKPDHEWLSKWYEQYPQLKNKKVITLPGRLTRLKGHNDFIQLVKKLHDKGVDVYGLIVGGEDPKRIAYAEEIKELVKTLGLQERIFFTGDRRDMRDVLAVSDVALSLSTKPESFGRTTLEALSLGLPVVGYDHGGVGEVLHQVYPFGAVDKQSSSLVDKVNELLGGMHENPRKHNFTLDKMLTKTLNLYESLISHTSV